VLRVSEERPTIDLSRCALGIELGSTRIKAVLTSPDAVPLATGVHQWENQYVDNIWTYSLDAVWSGLQSCVRSLTADLAHTFHVPLVTVGALGVSAMEHGYLPFDAAGEQLVPFRTWRNTVTAPAASALSDLFERNIPQRWSIAHLYQAILNNEPHVGQLAQLSTLASYVHWRLTGRRVIGVGDASGMFPIDLRTKTYDPAMVARFGELIEPYGLGWELVDLLPAPLLAGSDAGCLTAEGALLLDPDGVLAPGIRMCPPEGDGSTGMIATNCVAPLTGNVSAGTSIFAMVVLEKEMRQPHPELDVVVTPSGDPVAMAHCNNGGSELDTWAGLFAEFAEAMDGAADPATVFETLFRASLRAQPDAGGLLAYNYLSGEHITGFEEGRPLVLRGPGSQLTLANFVRAHLFAAFSTLRIGMDLLTKDEGVRLKSVVGHGGLFKTKGVAQRHLAAALDTPVSVQETAGEGGPWGMAVLAAYLIRDEPELGLADYLSERVFADAQAETITPDPVDVAGFEAFYARWLAGLGIERAAVALM
jgi:sugar (pentulose or hexulose) kinase